MYSRRDVESALSQRVVGPMCLLNNVDFLPNQRLRNCLRRSIVKDSVACQRTVIKFVTDIYL